MQPKTLRTSTLGFLALAGLVGTAHAAVLITDSATFFTQIQGDYETQNFESLLGGSSLPSYSTSGGATYPYSITAGSNSLYVNPAAGSLSQGLTTVFASPGQTMNITFSGANVTAAGAQMYLTDIDGNLITGTFVVTLNSTVGGTQQHVINSQNPVSYVGFTTTTPGDYFTSISLSGTTGQFRTVDNLTAGAAVPEPWTMGVVSAGGLLALAASRRFLRSPRGTRALGQ